MELMSAAQRLHASKGWVVCSFAAAPPKRLCAPAPNPTQPMPSCSGGPHPREVSQFADQQALQGGQTVPVVLLPKAVGRGHGEGAALGARRDQQGVPVGVHSCPRGRLHRGRLEQCSRAHQRQLIAASSACRLSSCKASSSRASGGGSGASSSMPHAKPHLAEQGTPDAVQLCSPLPDLWVLHQR